MTKTANTLPDSETRFSLIELDDGKPVTVQAEVAQPAGELIPGRDIVESGRQVAANERELVKDITGIELSSKGGGMEAFDPAGALIYDEGTKMMAQGVEKAMDSRNTWDSLPTARVATATLSAEVKAERRKDYQDVELANLIVDAEGHLTRANGGLRFTDWSWSQVRSMAPRGIALRNNFNSWLGESEASAVFRTRNPDPSTKTRQLFAAVSDRYAVTDGHDVLARVADRLPGMTRGRVTYSPSTTRLEADMTLHNPYECEDDVVVGRLHRLGLRYTTRDDGGERHRLRLYAERIACINCTLIPFDIAGLDKIHTGDAAAVWQAIDEILVHAESIMGQFADHWHAAHVTRIMDGAGTAEGAQGVFGRLVDAGLVEAGGIKRDVLVGRLVNAWASEPGYTYQSVNRAITRAAHGYSWAEGVSDELEEQAGQLLYQRVHVLNELQLGA